MEQTASDVAIAWMDAVAGGDEKTALSLSSPTIVYTIGQVRRYEGHDGVRNLISDIQLLDGFLEVRLVGTPLESDGVVALRHHEAYTLPSGGIEVNGCAFVEVENGRVRRWADYKSMAALEETAD